MIDRNVQLRPLVMWLFICLSIVFVNCNTLKLEDEITTQLENNKINKGIWVRHRHRTDDRQHSGHFFRSSSNEEEPFTNELSVINRDKRSGTSKPEKRYIKNIKGPKSEQDAKSSHFKNVLLGSILLENSNNKNIDYNGYTKDETKTSLKVDNATNELKQAVNSEYEKVSISEDDKLNYLKDLLNATRGNTTNKRSMKYDELIVDRIDLLEIFNKSKDFIDPKINGDPMWQSAPIPDKNLYEIRPKDSNTESHNPKPVTERGLIKVLSMLTRTFKKIMKQHDAIKVIHDQMNDVNKNFGEKIELNTKKLNDFDVKYTTIMKLIEKLSHIQDCLKDKEEALKKKEQLLSKSMFDFESQQNKFLGQQQQFYNIQKIMLMQNEKINEKQNTIAKMQSEITHRQNYFAKILQKVKQNIKKNKSLKLNTHIAIKNDSETRTTKTEPRVTTERTTSVEPVKINLLSIASNNIIENQDKMILKEKDEQSVDDLIYKYYFNNTFLDTVIRNKILGGIAIGDKTSIARSAKLAAKRNHQKYENNATKLKTTLLFPVMKSLKRERRWINHHSTRKHRKRHPSKGNPDQSAKQSTFKTSTTPAPLIVKESDVIANDPFLAMATKFCMEIGQSNTKQILDWCVEKTLRRLKSLDRKMMPPQALVQTSPQPKMTETPSTVPPVFKTTLITSAPTSPTHPPPTVRTPPALFAKDQKKNVAPKAGLYETQFFPDNQELESNLKQFDLTPDTAGNVYYAGSLHASDMMPDKNDDGVSDILPGLDSNSKIDIDPGLITLQLRRKYMRQNMAQTQNLWKD